MHNIKFLLCFSLLCVGILPVLSGNELNDAYRCGSIEMSQRVMDTMPVRKQSPHPDQTLLQAMGDATLLIPVVVHIVHDNGSENIHDSLVHNQIAVLNEDFGRYGLGDNDHPAGADMEIRFELVRKDPQGNPTDGINRIRSDSTAFNSNAHDGPFKRSHGWDPESYLNIYVVRIIDGNDGLAGYAYLPGSAAGENRDGIVINYRFFGRLMEHAYYDRFNKGKTLSHEVGHYLNLLHTWGDNEICERNDGIQDTPPCTGIFESLKSEGCPAPNDCGMPRMIENYMDYSDDGCTNIFTRGQKDRMRDALFRWRPGLINYHNLLRTGIENEFAQLNRDRRTVQNTDVYPNPVLSEKGELNIYSVYPEAEDTRYRLYNFRGKLVQEKFVEDLEHGNTTMDIKDLPSGHYFLRTERPGNRITHKVVIY